MSDSEESMLSEQTEPEELEKSDDSIDEHDQNVLKKRTISTIDSGSEDEEDLPIKRQKILQEKEDDLEDEEEQEEEDEEEELEEEKEDKQKKNKKKRRSRRRPTARDFIQDDVEVDSDDEEEEYETQIDGNDIIGIDPNERHEAERFLKEQEHKQRARNKYMDMTEEEMGRYFQERHAAQLSTHRGGDLDDDAYDDITQNGLLPSTKDPNLWTVKCRIGEEKLVALQLMRKFLCYENSKDPNIEPLQIKSVIVKDGIKGLIYIEAFKKPHVSKAIEGILALNSYTILMIPIREMVDTLKIVKDIPTLKPGNYVRLKRTMYKDDLAQVDSVDIAQNKVYLKIVPRIDYTRMRGALRNTEDRASNKTKRRPQPKLFNVEKIKQIGGEVVNDGDFYSFEGGQYRRGFLYKFFPMNSVIVDGVVPTISELERFQESADDLKKELETTLLKEKCPVFAPGDNIEVIDGELVNLRGKVLSINGDKVIIQPDHEDLTESLTLNAYELRKFFKEGDHVRVINGRYEGDTGLILKVEENLVILVSDLTLHELQLLPKDVQLCADVATGVDSIGQYQYQDLVMLDKETVGVIVRLEREHVEVLNMHGKSVRIKPQSIQSKKDSRILKAMDANKNFLQRGDLVRVVDGPHMNRKDVEEDKQGEIKHIYRTWVFLHSRKHPLHGGIFVCKARHLLLIGAKVHESNSFGALRGNESVRSGNNRQLDLLRSPNPAMTPAQSVSSGSLSIAQTAKDYGNSYGSNISHMRRDVSIIGKTVKIVSGPMKTYTGIVKDATEVSARVELHTIPKTINIERNKLTVVGGEISRNNTIPTYGSYTPNNVSDTSRTPMYVGAQTPMYGSGAQTPMHDFGSRTPHYGIVTPAYDSSGAGARTPSHGSSWDPTIVNTPAHSSLNEDFGGTNDVFESEGFSSSSGFNTSGRYNENTLDEFSNSSFGNSGFNNNHATPKQKGNFGTSMYSNYTASSPYPQSHSTSTLLFNNQPTSVPDNFLKIGDWCMVDLVVQVRRTYDDEECIGIEGTICSVLDGKCRVYFDQLENDNKEIPFEYLLPVKPEQGDRAVIIFGQNKDTEGIVISIDENEAVFRTNNDEMSACPSELLCKMN